MVRNNNYEEYNNFPVMKKLFKIVIPAIAGDQVASFADIIDNSIDARAKKIYLISRPSSENGRVIGSYIIADNGVGMDKKTLIESHRWCTDEKHNYGDLGKFGVGGSTACFSLAMRKTTYTKKKHGPLYKAVTDIQWLEDPEKNAKGVRIFDCTKEENEYFLKNCGDQGTMIVLTRPRLESASHRSPTYLNAKLIKEFSVIFGRLLNHRDLFIGKTFSDVKKVVPHDPFYNDNPSASLYNRRVDYNLGGKTFNIQYRILNHQIVGGLKKEDASYNAAGIWLYRNGRLISRAIRDRRLYAFHPQTAQVRIIVNVGPDMDSEIQVSATKNRFQPTQAFIDKIKRDISILKREAVKFIKTNTDTEDLIKLNASHKNMEDKLAKSANILNLPKTEEGVRYRNKYDSNERATKSTGTRSKKAKKTKSEVIEDNKKHAAVPKFEIVSLKSRFDVGPAFDYSWNDEGRIVISINQDHPWINEKYINGTPEVQKAFQEYWSCECIAEHDTTGVNEDHDFEVVRQTRYNTSKLLKTMNSL